VDSLGNVVNIDFGHSGPFSEEGGELDWASWLKMWRMIDERVTSNLIASVKSNRR
jgi:hypothetical protein